MSLIYKNFFKIKRRSKTRSKKLKGTNSLSKVLKKAKCEKYSTPLKIKEMQITTSLSCHFSPIRLVEIKKCGNTFH